MCSQSLSENFYNWVFIKRNKKWFDDCQCQFKNNEKHIFILQFDQRYTADSLNFGLDYK